MWAFSLFSKSHIGHVNHGNLKIFRGVGVSLTFLAVMRCSYQFFAVLRYSEPPNAPLYQGISRIYGPNYPKISGRQLNTYTTVSLNI